MIQWNLETLNLDLRYDWKISRASTKQKTIWIVRAQSNGHEGLGEVSLTTSSLHKPDDIPNAFKDFLRSQPCDIAELSTLDLPSPLKAGLESAWVMLLAKQKQVPVSRFLGIAPKEKAATSYSIPILPPNEIPAFVEQLNLNRFSSLKLKVEPPTALACCRALAKVYQGHIRVDANEAFMNSDQVLRLLEQVEDLNIEILEQPLPANCFKEYQKLKPLSPVPIFADESVQDQALPQDLLSMFHGVNIKLMKAGGYKRAIEQVEQAKTMGLKVMIGCMVETSLGIEAALNISGDADYLDLDGFLFFSNEPYGRILEEDGILLRTQP